jgi:hypothetical protein
MCSARADVASATSYEPGHRGLASKGARGSSVLDPPGGGESRAAAAASWTSGASRYPESPRSTAMPPLPLATSMAGVGSRARRPDRPAASRCTRHRRCPHRPAGHDRRRNGCCACRDEQMFRRMLPLQSRALAPAWLGDGDASPQGLAASTADCPLTGCLWMSPDEMKVEAGGIEPPSESHSPNASTCVSDDLSSSPSLPSAGSPATSRRIYLSPHPVGTMGAQPELRRSVPPYGRGQAERGSLIRLPVRSFRWQLSRSVLFNEVNSTPGTQRSLHDLRRNQIAPMAMTVRL